MPSIALEAAGDQEPTLPCRTPEALGTVPAIEQDMGQRPSDGLKGTDHGFHQVDLALEGHVFRCADRLLSIQLGSQWTASSQQHIQAFDQAMTAHPLVLCGRVMQAQSLHLLAFAFLDRRVIPDQIPCHDGWLGTASPFRLLLALSLEFCSDLWLHLFPKVPQPLLDHGCCFPWRLREKTAQPCQTRSISDLTQQSRKRSCSLAQHQPQ